LPEDVANLGKFESYTEAIPCGTLVLVGFLTSTFHVKVNKQDGDMINGKGKGKAKEEKTIPSVAHNLQFVAVLGNGEYMIICMRLSTTYQIIPDEQHQ
jgi:hypothetical protein